MLACIAANELELHCACWLRWAAMGWARSIHSWLASPLWPIGRLAGWIIGRLAGQLGWLAGLWVGLAGLGWAGRAAGLVAWLARLLASWLSLAG